MLKKTLILIGLLFGLVFLNNNLGMNPQQLTAVLIFSASVLATLMFWDFRVAIAFLGIAILLFTKTIDLENVIKFSSLEVILFLVGMMVLVGLLRESGAFAWLAALLVKTKRLTAIKFVLAISVLSALLACCVDEVTSIIFMVAAILEICDYFEVEPTPYIMISVLSTNIGSTGTVLGNPIGILIASKSGLTFEDFIVKAFPIMCVCLFIAVFMLIFWYRGALRKLELTIQKMRADNEAFTKFISVPQEKELKVALFIFGLTLLCIAFHHRLELLWNLETNTLLLSIPLFFAGCVMIWKWKKARSYIEKDVDWWTLLFFLLLFAKAGTLKYTGATDVIVEKIAGLAGNNVPVLTTLMLWVSALGSSILDNVVLVAAFIPIIQSFQDLNLNLQPLWWALLFGGCLGGNITLVGSTANIVALGILEKDKKIHITFLRWFWVGLTVSLITTGVAWIALIFLPFYRS